MPNVTGEAGKQEGLLVGAHTTARMILVYDNGATTDSKAAEDTSPKNVISS